MQRIDVDAKLGVGEWIDRQTGKRGVTRANEPPIKITIPPGMSDCITLRIPCSACRKMLSFHYFRDEAMRAATVGGLDKTSLSIVEMERQVYREIHERDLESIIRDTVAYIGRCEACRQIYVAIDYTDHTPPVHFF